jgi:hypothetical protein
VGAGAIIEFPLDGGEAAAAEDCGLVIGIPRESERVPNTATPTSRSVSKSRAWGTKGSTTKRPQMKVGKRCKVKRRFLYPALAIGTDAHKRVDTFTNREYNSFGTIAGREKHNVWKIKFDTLPLEHNIVIISREHITTLYPEEEEKPYNREKDAMESIAEQCATTTKKKSPSQHARQSIDAFLSLDATAQKTAKSFSHRFGPNPADKVEWQILGDSEQITKCPMEEQAAARSTATTSIPNNSDDSSDDEDGDIFPAPLKKQIPWNPNPEKVDYNTIFFENFFPSLQGKANVLDKFLSDPRWGCFDTVVHDKISFNRPNYRDPDHLVSVPLFVSSFKYSVLYPPSYLTLEFIR